MVVAIVVVPTVTSDELSVPRLVVAVMRVVPLAFAVTSPVLSTVATAAFADVHVSGSDVGAVSCTVLPAATCAVAGDTVIALVSTTLMFTESVLDEADASTQ